MLYGEQKRIFQVKNLEIEGEKVTVYCHNNGIMAAPNTKENIEALLQIEDKDISKKYNVLYKDNTLISLSEHAEEKNGQYHRAVIVLKQREKHKRRNK